MTESATAVDPQNTNDEAAAEVARVAEDAGRSARKKTAKAEELPVAKAIQSVAGSDRLDLLSNIEMDVTAELGRTRMTVRELLSLTPGTVRSCPLITHSSMSFSSRAFSGPDRVY